MAKSVIYTAFSNTLRNKFGGENDLFRYLDRFSHNMARWSDDFMGDTLNGTYQSTASGTSAVAAAINTGIVNGEIKFDCGTDNGGRSDLSIGVHYQGQLNAVTVARVKIDVVTTAKIESGFTDTISGTDAGGVNVLATPSFNATDGAFIVLDTNDTADFKGVAVNTDASAHTAWASGVTPAANTYYYTAVVLQGALVKYIIANADGNIIAESGFLAGPRATINMTPWAFFQNRSAAQHIGYMDMIDAWQRRTTTG